jgi:aldose sugar dehydrogenase
LGLRTYKRVILTLGASLLAVGAFLFGAAAYSQKYWPFGGRFELLDLVTARLQGSIARATDQYDKTEIESGYHDLVVERYPLKFRDWGPTGPLLVLGQSEFLVGTRLGEVYRVVLNSGKAEETLIGKIAVDENNETSAGVKDFLLTGAHSLLATVVTYQPSRGCFSMLLLEFEFDTAAKKLEQRRQLLETHPCVKPALNPEQGGRMIKFSADSILVSVGEGRKRLGGQLGKILKVQLADGAVTDFASGTRNAQGLFRDVESGQIFETEHGPRGGDEFNLIQQGKDYGWPKVSYGTPYEGAEAPPVEPGEVSGDHTGYEQPIFTFIPSIGISNLVRYPANGSEFPRWRDDFLVASLRAQSLYRMRLLDGRIIFAEPIDIGERIRDLDVLPNGAIVLKTDTPRLVIISHRSADRAATPDRP